MSSSAPEIPKEMMNGWSKVDKPAFGMSTNYLSCILAALTIIFTLFCKNVYNHRAYSSKFATISFFMFLLSVTVLVLNAYHLNYEEINNEYVLPYEESPIPVAMAGILVVYYIFKFSCEVSKTHYLCELSNNNVGLFIAVAASLVLAGFIGKTLSIEEPNNYGNLTAPVPEADPVVV